MNAPLREVRNVDESSIAGYYLDRIYALKRRIAELEHLVAERDEAIAELIRTEGDL